MASTLPRRSAYSVFCLVTSVAYLAILKILPSASSSGLYEASIHTSLPPLPRRLYCATWYSPRFSLAQNSRYSGLAAKAGSANMEWCLPWISASVYPMTSRKFWFAVRMVPSGVNSITACDLSRACSLALSSVSTAP